MNNKRPFFPPASRALLGGAVLFVMSALSYARWRYDVKQPLAALARVEQNRQPGDSAAYASAAYHAAQARLYYDQRWSASGYAAQGVAGILVGLGLLVSSRSRR